MKKSLLFLAGMLFLIVNTQSQTVTDIDGNVYNIRTIGTQEWMGSNLKTTRYQNGVNIPGLLDDFTWQSLQTGGRCWYNEDSLVNGQEYGILYNWYAVDDAAKLCPTGWRIPNYNDWDVLINFCGGLAVAGGILKERETLHWNAPNTAAMNQYNFTALPGGLRHVSGPFANLNNYGWWWASTSANSTYSWNVRMAYNSGEILLYTSEKKAGFSVRCIRDVGNATSDLNEINGLQLFPNPATDRISLSNTSQSVLNLEIYNSMGGLVLQNSLSPGIHQVDVSFLSPGLYFVQLSGSGLKSQSRFLKN